MKTTKTIVFSLAIGLIITILMLLLPKSVFAVKGSVTVDGVRVRKTPSTEAEILTDVYKTDTIEVLEKDGDWYKIKFGEYTGYMSAAYVIVDGDVPLTPENTNNGEQSKDNEQEILEEQSNKQESTETITETEVYMLPLLYSTKTDKITIDSKATVLKTINNWVYVSYGDKHGWVLKSKFEKLVPAQDAVQKTPEETPTNTAEEKKGYINVSSAVVRDKPSLEGEVLLGLSRNTEVTIIEETDEWNKIKTSEVEGYVAARLVSDRPTETTSRGLAEQRALTVTKYYISVSTANIREAATTSSDKLGTLARKAEVESIGEENGFYKVKYNDKIGYISKDLVVDSLDKVKEPESSTTNTSYNANPPSSGSAQGIVDYAMQFIGCRYVYAGASPSGFDCSGFVYYVLNNCGYSVGRTISAQMAKGAEVSRENLQSGDIVIFNDSSNSSIGHTGIYIGGGNFVHAANPSRGVVTDTMNSGYYDVRYVTARRF